MSMPPKLCKALDQKPVEFIWLDISQTYQKKKKTLPSLISHGVPTDIPKN